MTNSAEAYEQICGLVEQYVQQNDVRASATIYKMCQASVRDNEGTVEDTITPRMLKQLAYSGGEVSPSVLHFVAILNRMLCSSFLPPLLSTTPERRPRGADRLLPFYVDILTVAGGKLSLAVKKQLLLCIACVSVLTYNDLKTPIHLFLSELAKFPISEEVTETVCYFWISLTDVLSDPRIEIGPIRRATHRMTLQQNCHQFLDEMFHCGATLPAEVEVVSQLVAFMGECVVAEPQDVNPAFWRTLASHRIWLWSVAQTETANTEECVDMVCEVLRSLTTVDDTSEAMILAASKICWHSKDSVTVCRIIISIFEASVEEILAQCPPEHDLYQLVFMSISYLMNILHQDPLEAEVGNLTCEALSVLTQVLTPIPIVPMTADDSELDYNEYFTEMSNQNMLKKTCLAHFQNYLDEFQNGLAMHLCRVKDVKPIVEHCTLEHEDYDVVFDDLGVSLFTTYERICALTATFSSVYSSTKLLLLVLSSPTLCFEALTTWPAAELQGQAPALLVVVIRHAAIKKNIPRASESGTALWSLTQTQTVSEKLFHLWRQAGEGQNMPVVRYVAAALSVMASDVTLVQILTQQFKNMGLVWEQIFNSADPQAAQHIPDLCKSCATLVDVGVLPLSKHAYQSISPHLDAASQVELLSVIRPPDYEVLCSLLKSLTGQTDPALLGRVSRRVARSVEGLLSSGAMSVAEYLELLGNWVQCEGRNTPILFTLLKQSESVLPHARRLVFSSLIHFFSSANSNLTSNEELFILLDSSVATLLGGGEAQDLTSLRALSCWLISDSSPFLVSAGLKRLARIAHFFRLVCEHSAYPINSFDFVQKGFELFAQIAPLAAEEEDGWLVREQTFEHFASLAAHMELTNSPPEWAVHVRQAADLRDGIDRVKQILNA
ncbi:hypothetical protein ADEAN_000275600 [Angomonas deanei]|uniref:Uncharacterized protein n=1 Tax=Angomonas deanei TaxID=59799 RepID=A0A7G2C8D5_9TRYP|nr:hypothetical protein ADEAN_000275600 [Angomonas deanei]